MKRMKIAVVAVVVVAAALLCAHLAVNADWPGLLRSIHGR